MNRRWRGFTLVELIVVIAVIGILAAITVVGFSRYQADTRDARRESSVTTISEALEKYYDKNGEYPGCTVIQQAASVVTTSVLPGIQATALQAPQSAASDANAIECGQTLTVNGTDFFEYVGDGSTTCSTGASCLSYTLKYKDEASGTIKSQESRRQASLATSNQATVTVGTITASTVALSWTPVGNASSYKIQRATNSGFTANMVESTATATNTTVTGLNPTTLYYFRVAGVSNNSSGVWSSTVTATTLSIDPPVLNCSTVTSATQMTITWNAMPGATSYTLQRSTSASFTSPTITSGITGTSQLVSGLTNGTLYYYRAQSVSGSATSTWSATCDGGPVSAPTNIGVTSPSCGQATVTWTASTGATSYSIEFSPASNFSGSTTTPGFTGTSGTITNATQGATNYFRVFARLGSATSAASSSVNTTVAVCPPASYTIAAYDNNGYWTATSNAVCAAGTTPNYQWYANGGAWVDGDQYQTVGYYLGYGQGVTLTVNTRCYNGTGYSGWTGGSNSAGYTRGVPAPTWAEGLNLGTNRRVWTSWYDVCGGWYEMWLRQGSYTEYTAPRRWLGSSPYNGSTPDSYSEQDNRVWNSGGTIIYSVRAVCNNVSSGWNGSQSRAI